MLNIEKYKEEINDIIDDGDMTDEVLCNINCYTMNRSCGASCNLCKKEVIDWLCQEYVEPVLNDEAIAYLKNVLKPISQVYKIFRIHGEEVATWKLRFFTSHGDIFISYNSDTEIYEFFKKMKIGKAYEPKELGIC